MANKKLLSISGDYEDVWQKIQELSNSKQNASLYICEAVRYYIRHHESNADTLPESRIRQICREEIEKQMATYSSPDPLEDAVRLDSLLNSEATSKAFESFNACAGDG